MDNCISFASYMPFTDSFSQNCYLYGTSCFETELILLSDFGVMFGGVRSLMPGSIRRLWSLISKTSGSMSFMVPDYWIAPLRCIPDGCTVSAAAERA